MCSPLHSHTTYLFLSPSNLQITSIHVFFMVLLVSPTPVNIDRYIIYFLATHFRACPLCSHAPPCHPLRAVEPTLNQPCIIAHNVCMLRKCIYVISSHHHNVHRTSYIALLFVHHDPSIYICLISSSSCEIRRRCEELLFRAHPSSWRRQQQRWSRIRG